MKKALNIICGLFFALLIGTAVWAGLQIERLHMLAPKYLYPLLGVLLLVVLLLGVLMLPRLGRKERKAGRIAACVLAALCSAGFVLGAMAVGKVNETVDAVTTVEKTGAIVEVYVRRDSGIQTLEEAAGRPFGWTRAFDGEGSRQAITAVEETTGMALTLQEYPSVLQMVTALYDGKVDAIVLNSAYLGVMEGLDGYSDFSDKVTVLYSHSVTEVVEEPAPEEAPEEPAQPEPEEEPEVIRPEEPFVIYVSGSDTRSQILDTSRSDVNILVTVNPQTKQVLLVNTPRDYFVVNPVSLYGALDKLTHCGIYGVDCSMKALAGLYDQEIPYYAQINFTGFEALIDAVGGVTVHSDQAFSAGSFNFAAGENSLNGEQALAFARERYSFASGDNQRGKNQMEVIRAVIEKATSGTTIISSYARILESMQGMFVTNVPREMIENLVKMQLSDMASWDIKSYAVSGVGDSQPTYSAPDFYAYVMWPDEAAVAHGHDLMEAVLNGERLTDDQLAVPVQP